MPCKDCEKNPKLRTAVICPDPWINGAREDQTSAARKKSENKLLTSRARYSPYGGGGLGLNQKCSICKRQLAAGGKFCTECAHHRGLCYICGKVVMDTSSYTHHENKLLDEKLSRKAIESARPTVRQAPGAGGAAASSAEQAPAPKKASKPARDELDLAEQQAARAAAAAAAKQAAAEAQKADKAAGKGAAAASAQSAAADAGPQARRTIGEWTELDAGDGRVYFYNATTQEQHPQPPPPSRPPSADPRALTPASGGFVRRKRRGTLRQVSRARGQGRGRARGTGRRCSLRRGTHTTTTQLQAQLSGRPRRAGRRVAEARARSAGACAACAAGLARRHVRGGARHARGLAPLVRAADCPHQIHPYSACCQAWARMARGSLPRAVQPSSVEVA